MEQLCIVDQTIAELTAIVEKHEGCFPRIIASTLKDNGVDLQAYFSENILGNHCYKFGENGKAIIDTISQWTYPWLSYYINYGRACVRGPGL